MNERRARKSVDVARLERCERQLNRLWRLRSGFAVTTIAAVPLGVTFRSGVLAPVVCPQHPPR